MFADTDAAFKLALIATVMLPEAQVLKHSRNI